MNTKITDTISLAATSAHHAITWLLPSGSLAAEPSKGWLSWTEVGKPVPDEMNKPKREYFITATVVADYKDKIGTLVTEIV
jgi:hypothetical protein